MNKEMIISSTPHETRVAILEDDHVAEVFIERERHRGVVGNLYKGRVSKVLPGMQCAFVDLGLERDGFLYVADVVDAAEQFSMPCVCSSPKKCPISWVSVVVFTTPSSMTMMSGSPLPGR